jgi:hypothetical protein
VVIVGSASGVVGMGGEVADRARLVGAVRAAAARCGPGDRSVHGGAECGDRQVLHE